jgi:hypothetical protein
MLAAESTDPIKTTAFGHRGQQLVLASALV